MVLTTKCSVIMLFFIYLLFFINFVTSNEEYKGYKVYRLEVKHQWQQDSLSDVKGDLIDYWVKPSFKYGVPGLAMVPPSHFDWFEEQLTELNIARDVYIEDVYEYLSKESSTKERRKRSSRNEEEEVEEEEEDVEDEVEEEEEEEEEVEEEVEEEPFDIRRYNRYEDILEHLQKLADQYNTASETRVELVEYGVTQENRPLVYLKVTNINTQLPTVLKPVIVVEAGIIPREWITIPAVLYVIERLLAEQSYLQDYDWVVIPVANPDGYEYSHTNLRLWTKSRSTSSNWGNICPGVNINRNFDVDWLNFDASSSPCSHLYGGTEIFSEIETQMIKSIISDYGSRISLYLSLQNNGGYITYPWNYERAASGMFRQHHLLGIEMVNAAREIYNLDVGSRIFDRASGTSSDYARSNNILYTYNIDIVQRDGFIIPEEDIGDIVEDVWRIIATAATGLSR